MTPKPALVGAIVALLIAVLVGLAGALVLWRGEQTFKDVQPNAPARTGGQRGHD